MSNLNKNIGLFGYGVVGKGFYNFLEREGEQQRIPTIVVKSVEKDRDLNGVVFITDGTELLNIEIPTTIVEAINNEDDAFQLVSTALKNGKQVVSASKKLVANRLKELLFLEKKYGGTLLYEAAVAGSIPVIRILNDFYKQEEIMAIKGVLNGSSNFILSKIFNENVAYQEALYEAQEKGFAELDPASDVEGYDALYKLVILTLQGFGSVVSTNEVLRVGIQNITTDDIALAKVYGFKIKQVATVKLENQKLELSVVPTFIDSSSELFTTEQEYNAVEITSKTIGTQLYKGKGAGSFPTGSSVYADVKSIEEGYKYHYKNGENLIVNDNLVYELLVRLPDDYPRETLPFKTQLFITLNKNLFYVKVAKQELIKHSALISELRLSLLFFGNELVKDKLLAKIKEITPREFKLLRDIDNNVQLIDVREKWEFEHANIGGTLIPLSELENHIADINQTEQVVVLCRSGKRSANAIEFLQKKYNFNNLYNLKGGILAWADEIDESIEKY